ncbi:MAG: membrane protein insertion efficiency factor YidD [Candidatus Buchananbacteria bacterium RIFCSPLOWO2_01_FULL_39_33]|uniref:Putative membrane protein insertion efficiency factor n=1 Tax=Candidatus Buchananbacteria bacterium RIFCSPLOWO2_01_FULL_39_33 TaxID=1797543 RepID=A0A1G1YGJ6_9BACT|nr:MAG: membrane protein insertion efficiency factor YidD [Candidatus Buchananbacteria bacterium RIFCSPHIGHO2_01_FULL_40_35]OGY51483.1 MAG: membrane protein insertion efficiency factor YidD [Candidatus Buchananbacteria bacterium RIFCSPLOWO2_01_FULL_39_33]
MPTTLNYLPHLLVLKLIRIYQKTLSFDHGLVKIFFPNGYCKYRPTCSQYAYQSVEKYGIIKGGLIAAWRVLRCNPFSGGGHDPVK